MNSDKLDIIREAFDGARAIDYASCINKTDSQFTFPAFHKTSKAAAALMEECGLVDINIYSFKADGRVKYGDWTVPRAWDVKDAGLWIKSGKRFVKIADRKKNFCNVMMYSAPTSGGKQVECGIVSEHDRDNWAGNLVFTDNPHRIKPATLAKKCALGVVTDYLPEWKYCRQRQDVYDIALWENAYLAPANEHNLAGFQLTPRQGDKIRDLYNKGWKKIQAKAFIDSFLYDGTMDFVTGVIPGWKYPDEEVAVFAHLFEPGANDNASGCAMGLESLRTIKNLKDKGKLKSPKRSIRLCYTFEIYGTLAFFESYPDKMKKIIAGINPDMVAPDMEKCRSRLHVHGTPDSACSYVDALITGYIENAFSHNYLLRWSERPFFINDNFVTDPAIGIPSPALVCLRDRYYHSSGDVPGNLSADTMHAIGSAMTSYLHDIACGEYKTAVKLVDSILARQILSIEKTLNSDGRPPAEELIQYSIKAAETRLRTVKGFLAEPEKKGALARHIKKAVDVLRAFGNERVKMTGKPELSKKWKTVLSAPARIKSKAQNMYPRKTVLGTVSTINLTGRKTTGREWSYRYNAPLFRADGVSNVYEIWRNYLFEFHRIYDLENVVLYFEQLERDGHVIIERKNTVIP